MGSTININGVDTQIDTVDFNGNSDISYIYHNGVEVWARAPTALEVAQAIYDDTANWFGTGVRSGTDKDITNITEFCQGWRFTHDTSSYYTREFDVDFSLETDSFYKSPYVSIIAINTGDDDGGGIHGDMSHWIVGDPAYTLSTKAYYEVYSGSGWMGVSIVHIPNSLQEINKVKALMQGASGNNPIEDFMMILPNKWGVTKLGQNTTDSAIIAPGEFVLHGHAAGGPDGYSAAMLPSSNNTPNGNSLVLEHDFWWYDNASFGMYTNLTAGNETYGWTDYNKTMIMKLTQVGIS